MPSTALRREGEAAASGASPAANALRRIAQAREGTRARVPSPLMVAEKIAAAQSFRRSSTDRLATIVDELLRLGARAARAEVKSGALRGAALLELLRAIPPVERDAW